MKGEMGGCGARRNMNDIQSYINDNSIPVAKGSVFWRVLVANTQVSHIP